MTRKRKHPHRHTGKVLPVRTAEHIRRDVEGQDYGNAKPSLKHFRQVIASLVRLESDLLESELDIDTYRDRTAVLAECATWIDLIENRYLKDEEGNPQTLSPEDAEYLAFNSMTVGMLIGEAKARLMMEEPAADGLEHSMRGRKQARQNQKRAFQISKADLLARCRKHYRRHRCNQKKLAEHVAAELPVGAERVRQFMRDHQIRKADYA